MTTLAGGNALSSFRAQQLQPALEAIHPKISGIAARFVHLVATDAAPTPTEQERLAALLTYGDPYAGPEDGAVLIVTPRLGTLSPWASKATDIARNCGIAIRRVERITEYRISLKSGLLGKTPELTAEQLANYQGPTYAMFELDFGVRMVRAEEKIRAVLPDEEQAQLLQITPATPLLSVERIAYTYNDVPMELRRGLYLTDTHHYRNELN